MIGNGALKGLTDRSASGVLLGLCLVVAVSLSVGAVAGEEAPVAAAGPAETAGWTANAQIAPEPVVGTDRPTDPDGDGYYEDVNGNGLVSAADAQALLAHLDTIQSDREAFDFDADGSLTRNDVALLFKSTTIGFADDSDLDGLIDSYERSIGTDPLRSDSDVAATGTDEAGDGTSDGDADFEDDSLPTRIEMVAGTDPFVGDTDGDGLGDRFEVRSPTLSATAQDSDGDGTSDPDSDPDGDGLSIESERQGETDPFVSDTDGDGLADGTERDRGTDPVTNDSDGDGLEDGTERDLDLDPRATDTDDDGSIDSQGTYTDSVSTANDTATVTATGDARAVADLRVDTVDGSALGGGALGDTVVSDVVRVRTNGSVANATVTLQYDPNAVDDPANLSILRFEAGEDELTVLDGQVDRQAKTVTADTEHFSHFAVVPYDSGSTADERLPVEPNTPKAGETVTFDASSIETAGRVNEYVWHFGDGAVGTGEIATHRYEQPGRYQVRVEISAGGRTITRTRPLVVEPSVNGSTTSGVDRNFSMPVDQSAPGDDVFVFNESQRKYWGDESYNFAVSGDDNVSIHMKGSAERLRVHVAYVNYNDSGRTDTDTPGISENKTYISGPAWSHKPSDDTTIMAGGNHSIPNLDIPSNGSLLVYISGYPLQTEMCPCSTTLRVEGVDRYTHARWWDGADATKDYYPLRATFDTVTGGKTLTVDASGSGSDVVEINGSVVSIGGAVESYRWSFGDGSTATGEMAFHRYTEPGTYEVSLTVTTDEGATATATETVTIPNASVTSDQNGNGIPDTVESRLRDRAKDPDLKLRDPDGDGLPSRLERNGVPVVYSEWLGTQKVRQRASVQTDPNAADSDGDGLADDAEILVGQTVSVDGTERYRMRTFPNETDSDLDGLDDDIEAGSKLFALKADTDGDGLDDALEKRGIPVMRFYNVSEANTVDRLPGSNDDSLVTDPLSADTDGDSVGDGVEIGDETIDRHGLTFHQINSDPTDPNTDDGGVDDSVEYRYGSNPRKPEIVRATLSHYVYTEASKQRVRAGESTEDVELAAPATYSDVVDEHFVDAGSADKNDAWVFVPDTVKVIGHGAEKVATTTTKAKVGLEMNGPAQQYLDDTSLRAEPVLKGSHKVLTGSYSGTADQQGADSVTADGSIDATSLSPVTLEYTLKDATIANKQVVYVGDTGLTLSNLDGTAFEVAADGDSISRTHPYYVRTKSTTTVSLSSQISRASTKTVTLHTANPAGAPAGIGTGYRNYMLGAMKVKYEKTYDRIKSRPEWYAAASIEGYAGWSHILRLKETPGLNGTAAVTVIKLQL